MALGALVGVMAGLLGIGGGLLVVPSLVYLLPHAGIEASVTMRIALATSLATIIITSGSAALNHVKFGNVDTFVIKWLMPGVLVGGALGSFVADKVPTSLLPQLFGGIVLVLALQMLISIRSTRQRTLPSASKMVGVGTGIGVISSLAGIGGGSLSVPFLSRHGIEMRRAVGSSSVCGFAIAVAGMSGFIFHGYSQPNLPEYSVGYVYLPALGAIAVTSLLTTRIGAKLASTLPTQSLKKLFALFLIAVGISMLC
ncbi:sulfite exporter TauE/SafE family protein [Vibrio sp. SM6]|uniref:Probable membrane transporter protein n=1 Tax=Vibrio agarilyticus TaxID=2726741 RepID=A0A7X8TP74_9VIBR|nr:sulfite exporter TauE/SafE family protein [Vibrio agarilyticus]NLS12244.1 sulfite exporter TauE/SafE family protein [Vibrio agarilyticus]